MCHVFVFNQSSLIPLVILDYGTYPFLVLKGISEGKKVLKYFWFFFLFYYFCIEDFFYYISHWKENNQYMWHVAGFKIITFF